MTDLGGVLKFNNENAIHVDYDPETDEIVIKHWNPSTNEWKILTTGGNDSMFVIKPYSLDDRSNKTYREVAEAYLDGQIVLFVDELAASPDYGYKAASYNMVCSVTTDENGEITGILGSTGAIGFTTNSSEHLDDKIKFYME